ILMGPTSDLGPVDPQLVLDATRNILVPAKDLIAAVEAATEAVQEKPATFPVHASLLAGINALLVQQARSALARSEDLVKEALGSVSERSGEEVERLCELLKSPLIAASQSHGAVFGHEDAKKAGLPVILADPGGDQWHLIWRLWMKYFVGQQRIYEGSRASKTVGSWSPGAG
ncbi:MAG: SDH family Clp fold serine proteinase, partial [Acidimicrobiales bacterium]